MLIVVTTHPIQYMAPWFRRLNQEMDGGLKVIFLREPNAVQQGKGFGQSFLWDVPLREGYESVVLNLEAGRLGTWRALCQIKAFVDRHKRAKVLLTGWNDRVLLFAYFFLALWRIPIIVRGEANDLRERVWLVKLVQRVIVKLSSAAVVIGAANRRFYLARGLREDVIFPGTYFVNNDHMLQMNRQHRSDREEMRRAFGFGEDDFVFSFVGKHVVFKRPQMIIDAAAICQKRGARVKLLFAGSGALTGSLKAKAVALNITAHFTGFLNQSEMWKAYIPADAFVLPSTSGETWGLVTNEAMLFELPVIVCQQVGCAEDLVVEGETGYVFDGDSEALAECMLRLMSDRERSAEMGRNGQRRIVERNSMDVATRGLQQAIAYLNNARV